MAITCISAGWGSRNLGLNLVVVVVVVGDRVCVCVCVCVCCVCVCVCVCVGGGGGGSGEAPAGTREPGFFLLQRSGPNYYSFCRFRHLGKLITVKRKISLEQDRKTE